MFYYESLLVKVKFHYAPQNDDELELEIGQIIEVINPAIFDGWMEGKLDGKKGVFPDNFVEVIEDRPATPTRPLSVARPLSVYNNPEPTADPEPVEEDVESQLRKPKKITHQMGGLGDIVSALAKRKQLASANEESAKPFSAPVASVEPTPMAEDHETSSSIITCTAHHEYEAVRDDELSFQVGDVVEIVNQDDPNWWEGTFNGKKGVFPSNFVNINKEDHAKLGNRGSLGPRMLPTSARETVLKRVVTPVEKPAVESEAPTSPGAGVGFLNKPTVKKIIKEPIEHKDTAKADDMPIWMKKRLAKMGEIDPNEPVKRSTTNTPATEGPARVVTPPIGGRASLVARKIASNEAVEKEKAAVDEAPAPAPVTKKWTPKTLPAGAVPMFPMGGMGMRGAPPAKAAPPPAEKGVDLDTPAAAPALENVNKNRVGQGSTRRPPTRMNKSVDSPNVGGDALANLTRDVMEMAAQIKELREQLEEERAARLALEDKIANMGL